MRWIILNIFTNFILILTIYLRSYFTSNKKVIGIANAFSGGIFLCVALLHLLPESTEIFSEYFERRVANLNTIKIFNTTNNLYEIENTSNETEDVKKFPVSYLLAFIGYTIILMIEKIIFDTHEPIQDEEEEDQDEDEEKDPYPLFELKEEV